MLTSLIFAAQPVSATTPSSSITEEDCSTFFSLKEHVYKCGFLIVPENYSQPDGNKVEIPFLVRLPEPSNNEDKESSANLSPVLITGGGGPGGSILNPSNGYGLSDDSFWAYETFSVYENRPLIILENRGIGLSRPDLDCDHYEASFIDFYLVSDPNKSQEIEIAAERRCLERLRNDGVDVTQYNVRNAALDIEELRRLLALDSSIRMSVLNLYGVSYGTRVAMYYERLFPDRARAMILDSVSIYEENPLVGQIKNTQRAFDLVFLKCREDKICTESYGESLETDFYNYLDNLSITSLSITVTNPRKLAPVTIPLTSDLVLDSLYSKMYSEFDIASIPLIMRTAINGSSDLLAEAVRSYIADSSTARSLEELAYTSYLCFDNNYINSTMYSEYESKSKDYKLTKYWPQNYLDHMRKLCTLYDLKPDSDLDKTAYTIETPTLLLSGELDPVTPASNAQVVARSATVAWEKTWKNIAHDVISASNCAQLISAWFLSNPTEDPFDYLDYCYTTENNLQFEVWR